MIRLLSLLLPCLLLSSASASAIAGSASSFPAHELVAGIGASHGPWDEHNSRVVLGGSFGIKWRVQGDEVVVLLSCSSAEAGWLGFGFGEPSSGSMLGADLVVASVDETTGQVEASDTHVPFVAYPMDIAPLPFPEEDEQQDWIALGGGRSENGTVVVLKRKLDTGDDQDRVVPLDKPTRVLFAFGSGPGLSYHGSNRGVDKISFGKAEEPRIPPDADSYIDVVAPDVVLLEGVADSYLHYSMDLGDDLDDIVGASFDAVSPSGHHVHHTILYDCGTPDKKEWSRNLGNARVKPSARPVSTCVPMFGWALGGDGNLVVPPEAGLKRIRYVILEIHYSQPLLGHGANGEPRHAGAGSTDASGFRIYTTSKPRRLKAGSMIVSTMGRDGQRIPAGEPFAHYESICAGECTQRNPKPLHVYNSFLHMHSHGRQIWASHYDRDMNFKGFIGKTENWNFRFQNYIPVNVTVNPGDTLGVHCVFDTTKSKEGPVWGDNTRDEMCLVILQFFSEEEARVEQCGGTAMSEELGIRHPAAVCGGQLMMAGTKVMDPSLDAPCDAQSYGTFPLRIEFNPGQEFPLECHPDQKSLGRILAFVLATVLVVVLLIVAYTDAWPFLRASPPTTKPSSMRKHGNAKAALNAAAPEATKTDSDDIALEGPSSSSPAESATDPEPKAAPVDPSRVPENTLVQRARDFVARDLHCSAGESILDRFGENVLAGPDELLYAWLNDNADVTATLTRKQLWDQSTDLAFYLQTTCGVKPGDRVMIVYPFGIDFMVGIVALLRLGAIIVSVYPPNPQKLATDIPKFAHFVKDCGATVALTTTSFHRLVQASQLIHKAWPQGITWVKSDKKRQAAPGSFVDYKPNRDEVALIQYTSGSTSDPKGVMLTHGNLNHQVAFLQNCYHLYSGTSRQSPDAVVNVSWTPQFHDMSLFGSFLVYLSLRGTSYTMSPLTFMRNPTIWVTAMQRYKASVTNGPNFSFALACKRLREQKEKDPSLTFPKIPSMKFVVYGAEPSDIRLLKDIEDLMGIDRSAVASMFGLAEHVVAVSSGASQTLYDDMLWSVGSLEFTRLAGDIKILIVHPETRKRVTQGETGEIWVSSQGVGVGYWGNNDATTDTFKAQLEGGGTDTYLRTGDLGFVRDGELFIVSRMKDVIILNGKNISPTDLENAATEGFPKCVRPGCSAAFQATSQSAVLLCEVRPEAKSLMSMDLLAEKIRSHVQEVVEGAVLDDVVLLQKGGTKKTSSGKVKRQAMKQLWAQGQLKTLTTPADGAAQRTLSNATSIEDLFRLVGVTDFGGTLVENGVDSMQLVRLVEAVKEQFGLHLNYGDASTMPVGELVLQLGSQSGEEAPLLRVPCDIEFSEECASKLLPGAVARWLRQSVVLLVVVTVVLVCFLPAGFYLKLNWDFESDLWIHNARHGPLVAMAFPIWALTYSAACILLKWILVGRLREGQSFALWSSGFARWYTVSRLVNLWDFVVGTFVMDTPLPNLFYNALGANIDLTARLHSAIDCWDLVTIGPRAEIKGAIVPRMMHWTGVYFQNISIGQRCIIGSGAVVMTGSELARGVQIANRSVVPPGSKLGPEDTSWCGVPCKQDEERKQQQAGPSPSCSLGWAALRTAVPFVLFFAVVAAWWMANEIGPGVPESGVFVPEEVRDMNERIYRLSVYYRNWHSNSFGVWASYVLVHEIAGLLMFAACCLLKWSFLCPYLVDRMEPLILGLYFPFIPKTFLHVWWHRLFGMKIGKGAVIVSTGSVVAPSLAHRVQVGPRSIVFSCSLLPLPAQAGTADDVWQWILSRGNLQSPWASLFQPRDIVVGSDCELAAGSFIESSVQIHNNSGTGTATRVTKNVEQATRVVGNPGELTLASKTTASSCSSNELPLAACMLIRNLLALCHFAYLFAGVVTILEISNALPFPSSWDIEYTLPCKVALAVALLVTLLALEILIVKHIVFGRTRTASISLRTCRGLVYHHLQVLEILFTAVASPIFNGLYPMLLFYKALGADIAGDVSSVFFSSYVEPGDADGITLRPHSVVDEGSYCVCHRVDHGTMNHGKVLLNSGATLHPGSVLMLGSLGRGSQLFPLSKALRETHTEDNRLWIGYPSVQAESVLMETQAKAAAPSSELLVTEYEV